MPIDLDKCWTEQPLVFYDCETTGVDVATCGVVQVGAVRFEDGRVTKMFDTLVNPGMPIPEAASSIHGITDAHVADAPTLDAVAHDLLAVADGAIPAGYNAQAFDRPILHRFISGLDCPLFDMSFGHWLDVLTVVRECDRYAAGTGRHKLEATCKRHGVEIDKAHSAIADAAATGWLLAKLLARGHVKPCPLGRLQAHMQRMSAKHERDFQEYRARQARKEGSA